jgi:hypothetical protein
VPAFRYRRTRQTRRLCETLRLRRPFAQGDRIGRAFDEMMSRDSIPSQPRRITELACMFTPSRSCHSDGLCAKPVRIKDSLESSRARVKKCGLFRILPKEFGKGVVHRRHQQSRATRGPASPGAWRRAAVLDTTETARVLRGTHASRTRLHARSNSKAGCAPRRLHSSKVSTRTGAT